MAWARTVKGFCRNKLCDNEQYYIESGLILDKPVDTCSKCGFKTIYAMPPINPVIESVQLEMERRGLINTTEVNEDG